MNEIKIRAYKMDRSPCADGLSMHILFYCYAYFIYYLILYIMHLYLIILIIKIHLTIFIINY